MNKVLWRLSRISKALLIKLTSSAGLRTEGVIVSTEPYSKQIIAGVVKDLSGRRRGYNLTSVHASLNILGQTPIYYNNAQLQPGDRVNYALDFSGSVLDLQKIGLVRNQFNKHLKLPWRLT